MTRPPSRSLVRTLRRLRRDGTDLIVSTLTEREAGHYRLYDEWRACKEAELDFVSWPIPEHGLPHDSDAEELLPQLARRLAAGEHVVVHCAMALGRSPMVATALLVESGIELDDAERAVDAARGRVVPTYASQRAWVRRWASARSAHSHS